MKVMGHMFLLEFLEVENVGDRVAVVLVFDYFSSDLCYLFFFFFFLNQNLLSFVVNHMVDMYATVKNSNGPANCGATHLLFVLCYLKYTL